MNAPKVQKFDVGIKAAFFRQNSLLLVQQSDERRLWELPGGRFNIGEEFLKSEEVLRREILEELGPAIQYTVGPVIHTFVVQFRYGLRKGDYVFLVVFRCDFIGGEIQLSHEHESYKWISLNDLDRITLIPEYEKPIRSILSARRT